MLGEMFVAALVHWVVGKGADKGLEYLRGNDGFNRDIEKVIEKWAKARGMTPDIFFSPVSGETDEGKGEHLTAIREKLHTGWPEIKEWHQAFIERWEYINKNLKGRHSFFDDSNREQAKAELKELAKAVYDVCKRNPDVFQRAVIDKLDGLKDEMRGRAEIQTKGLKVSTSKLPLTGRELFGRDGELKLLDEAWGDERTKIISFVAWGGVGKTALVNEWLNLMGEKNWQGAQRVYGWSFYSQGTTEDRQASSDTFLANALEWFGDKETAESAKSAWDKGVRLAELVKEQKTLLILDGVEPLQYPPGPMKGRLKDQGLQGLLRELSRGMNGLCVITTREEIKDIEGQVGHSVKLVELENLSPEAGMQVLRKEGVKNGTDKELMQASEEFGGHALALTLLGNFLAVVHKGEIRKRDLIPALMDEEEQGGHAKRVMKSYEIWLKDNSKAELDILYLMGLFDRPAEKGAIDALRAKPEIKGLTDNLAGLSEAKWKYAVEHLQELHLLGKEEEDRPDDLDCHPLVREHFGEKLKKNKSEAWQEGHRRLYEYYKGVPEKEQPDTLEEMEPLFRAVYHGCAAGRYQETFYDVYWRRIKRRDEHYSTRQLGAFGSDLGAVACFFDVLWSQPASGLEENIKAGILNFSGFRLRALGRLSEATQPLKATLEKTVYQEDWINASVDADNLSGLYLTLGEVDKAVEYGRKNVEYADKSGDLGQRIISKTALADALHQAGDIEEARRLFEEAEGMQRNDRPEYQYLYSLQGYRYCDLLLAKGKTEEVKKRATQTLEWMTNISYAPVLTIVLDKLSIGRAWLEELRIEKLEGRNREKCLAEAKKWLDEAVDGLRKAGTQDFLPRGLFARVEYYSVVGEYKKALVDLNEVREIAERGEMKLWLADYHLEAAKLALSENSRAVEQGNRRGESETGSRPTTCRDAKEHYEEAKRLINECGYHRRDKELEELKGRI
jgi:tetratricopeptide (TPR) repeat protein